MNIVARYTDSKANIKYKVWEAISFISFNEERDMAPIYQLGSVSPRSYSRHYRKIRGYCTIEVPVDVNPQEIIDVLQKEGIVFNNGNMHYLFKELMLLNVSHNNDDTESFKSFMNFQFICCKYSWWNE